MDFRHAIGLPFEMVDRLYLLKRSGMKALCVGAPRVSEERMDEWNC